MVKSNFDFIWPYFTESKMEPNSEHEHIHGHHCLKSGADSCFQLAQDHIDAGCPQPCCQEATACDVCLRDFYLRLREIREWKATSQELLQKIVVDLDQLSNHLASQTASNLQQVKEASDALYILRETVNYCDQPEGFSGLDTPLSTIIWNLVSKKRQTS